MRSKIVLTMLGIFLSCGGLATATNIDFNSVNPVGTIQGGDNYDSVTLHDSAIVNMTGGSATSIDSFDSSTVNLQDGLAVAFLAHNSSILNMSRGTVNNIALWDSSTVNLSGGQSQTGILSIAIADLGTVNVYGYGFNYVQSSNSGWLYGYWADNSPFTMYFRNLAEPIPNSHVILNETPEPATISLILFSLPLLSALSRRS